jgi:hypothetical protein
MRKRPLNNDFNFKVCVLRLFLQEIEFKHFVFMFKENKLVEFSTSCRNIINNEVIWNVAVKSIISRF